MKRHTSFTHHPPLRQPKGVLLAPVLMGLALMGVLAVAWLSPKVGTGSVSPSLGQWQQGLTQLKQQWQPASHNTLAPTANQQQTELLTLANGLKKGVSARAYLASSKAHPLSVNYGRPDPMMPLVQSAQASFQEAVELDPLAGIAYVGMLKGNAASANVALIEFMDEASNNVKTMVKALGQSFSVNGVPVKLVGANPGQLTLSINGKQRTLPLSDGQQKATIKATTTDVTAAKLPSVQDLEE